MMRRRGTRFPNLNPLSAPQHWISRERPGATTPRLYRPPETVRRGLGATILWDDSMDPDAPLWQSGNWKTRLTAAGPVGEMLPPDVLYPANGRVTILPYPPPSTAPGAPTAANGIANVISQLQPQSGSPVVSVPISAQTPPFLPPGTPTGPALVLAASEPVVSDGTVDRIRAWLDEQSIIAGYANKWVVLGAAAVFYLLRRSKG